MQVTDVLIRGATAPIRLGLSLGGAGLSAARTVVDELRHAVDGEDRSRSAGWTRPHPPRVWSPAPAIRRRLSRRDSDESPSMASLDIAEPPAARAGAGGPGAAATPQATEVVESPPPVPPPAAEGPTVPAVPPRGAKQVDDEPVQVAEVAERGAEDGAGAEVHVDPTWHGYDALTAADVRDRLAAADASVATAVALYEGAHRGRVSVVRAAERRIAALA